MATTSGNQTDFGNGVLANNVVQLDPTTGLPAGGATSATLQYTDGGGSPVPVTEVLPLPVEQAALSDVDKPLVAGTVAHDGVDSGNPVKIGGKARTTNPTAVADGDRVDGAFDKLGRQLVVLGQPRELRANQTALITSSTAETTILTAGAAGVFHDLTHLIIANESATDVYVDIRDDTAGSIVMTIAVKAGATGGFTAAKSYTQTTAAKNWTAQCSASVASVRVTVQADKNI